MTMKMWSLALAPWVRQDVDPAHVDPPVLAGQCHPEGLAELVQGQLEVARQQVAGAGREQTHGCVRAGEGGGDGAHGPVAAQRADDRGAGSERLRCLRRAGILDGGLDPHRLVPPGLETQRGQLPTHRLDVAELGGVHDHRCPLERSPRGERALGTELVPGGAPATEPADALPVDRRDRPGPQHRDGEQGKASDQQCHRGPDRDIGLHRR